MTVLAYRKPSPVLLTATPPPVPLYTLFALTKGFPELSISMPSFEFEKMSFPSSLPRPLKLTVTPVFWPAYTTFSVTDGAAFA